MDNPATLSQPPLYNGVDLTISSIRRGILVAVACLLLFFLNEVWNHSQGTELKSLNLWTVFLPGAIMVGGVGCGLFALARLKKWRASCAAQIAANDLKVSALQVELAENRGQEALFQKVRLELEQRLAAMEKTNSSLRNDFEKLNRAEKRLDEQRQELARSKSVLEVHVQERTQKIQQLQHRYSLILDSAGEGICGLDLEGRATFVNPAAARITGWKIEELMGKPVMELLHLQPPGQDGAVAVNSVADQVMLRRDGSRSTAEFIHTPIHENGRPVGAVLIFKDISERKQAEATLAHKASELARSNAELEQFAFVASHDLQEPLRKIQAFGDRLKIKCDAAQLGEGRDYLERMLSASARMQRLINDLLSFSRVYQTGDKFAPVDLNTVVREVLSDMEVRIESTKARFEITPLPTIEADPTQMRQLFQNLLCNALKFQPPNRVPEVKITARLLPENPNSSSDLPAGTAFYEFVVQDNGIGFDEVYAEKIFVVFQRLHGRTEYEGTGVGLAVCRRIADRHHGSIKAICKPAQGAAFAILLPVKQCKKDSRV